MYKYENLKKGKFIKRYKRFFTDIEFEGETITAHNPNTGSMKMMLKEGREVLFSESDNPKRKLKYTVEAFYIDDLGVSEWALSNTILMNKIAENAILDGEVAEFANAELVRREYKFQDSRIDFYIEHNGRKCLVELKNVTLFDETHIMFPDAVTERGKKHLETLMRAKDEGYEPYMLYLCQVRRDTFRCASEIDPEYCKTLEIAKKKGVKVLTYFTDFDEITSTVRLVKCAE